MKFSAVLVKQTHIHTVTQILTGNAAVTWLNFAVLQRQTPWILSLPLFQRTAPSLNRFSGAKMLSQTGYNGPTTSKHFTALTILHTETAQDFGDMLERIQTLLLQKRPPCTRTKGESHFTYPEVKLTFYLGKSKIFFLTLTDLFDHQRFISEIRLSSLWRPGQLHILASSMTVRITKQITIPKQEHISPLLTSVKLTEVLNRRCCASGPPDTVSNHSRIRYIIYLLNLLWTDITICSQPSLPGQRLVHEGGAENTCLHKCQSWEGESHFCQFQRTHLSPALTALPVGRVKPNTPED